LHQPLDPCILWGNGVFTLTRLIALALLALTFAAPFPALAQDEDLPEMMTYDPTFTGIPNEAADYIRGLQKQSLVDKGFIKPQMVQVAIVHHPYMEEDQFGIQMSVPDMVSGCYTLTPLEYEAKFLDPHFLDIKVKKYRRVPPEGTSAQAKCDKQNKMSTALMVLSRKDLQARGTQEIRFTTEVASDNYKVILSDTHIELIPRSMVIFKAQPLGGPLKDRIIYTFASSKMVALQVPMSGSGENLYEEIRSLAYSRGLVPANNGEVAWNGNGRATYYFYDDSGLVISRITDGGYTQLGTIEVNRPYDGPEGRSETPVPLTVFATRPGTQL
jgi:hypothetical protein